MPEFLFRTKCHLNVQLLLKIFVCRMWYYNKMTAVLKLDTLFA